MFKRPVIGPRCFGHDRRSDRRSGSPPCEATSPGVRVPFQQAVKGDSRIAIDLEVFRFDVDHDEFAGLLVNIDLRAGPSRSKISFPRSASSDVSVGMGQCATVRGSV
jgi:hypothetical protein